MNHIYRLCLRLLPRDFRERNGGEMQEVARALLDGKPGYLRALGLLRACADVALTGLRLRLGPASRGSIRGRESRRARLAESLGRDVFISARGLLRRPGFALVTISVLAIGVGSAVTILTVANGVLLRPLPYPESDRIGILWHEFGSSAQNLPLVNPKDVWDYREWSEQFSDFTFGSGRDWVVGEGGDLAIMLVAGVEAGFFEFFGQEPVLGRLIRETDDRPESPPVVVLGHHVWQDRFGGAPDVVGSSLKIRGEPHQIIGVLPARFRIDLPTESRFLGNADIWVPTRLGGEYPPQRSYTVFTAFARLAQGATFAGAQEELTVMGTRLAAEHEELARAGLRPRVVQLQVDVVKGVVGTLRILLVAVGLMLVVACANTANLLLVRGHARGWELAVRNALGAGRRRVFFLVMSESMLLGIAGGLLGIGAAALGVRALSRIGARELPLIHAVGFDRNVIAAAIVLSLGAALLAGLVPALRATSRHPAAVLAGSRRASPGRASAGFRELLVGVEIALTAVLLVGAGLLVQSFLHLQKADPGYSTSGSVTAQLALDPDSYPTAVERRSLYSQLRERILGLPQVAEAGYTSLLPLAGPGWQGSYAYDEHTRENWESVSADGRWVSPGFIRAMGASLLAGRDFVAADQEPGVRVMIIDHSIADRAFPGVPYDQVVGRTLQTSESLSPDAGDFTRVVGVVRHMKLYSVTRTHLPQMYRPMSNAGWFTGGDHVTLVVRGEGDLQGIPGAIRREVAATGPGVVLHEIEFFEDYVDRANAPSRMAFLLMAFFGVTALLLACVGLYGVLAYAVSHRRKEIGIRLALGQRRDSVRRHVVASGLRTSVIATILGLGAAWYSSRSASGVLYDVEPTDPMTYAGVGLLLILSAVFASWIPARRATGVDPVDALRAE